MDILTPEKRSLLMSRIRSKGNFSTEVAFLKALRSVGVKRWRRHSLISGFKPDFVFKREKVVVFVDGCFWHSCPLHGSVPKSNKDFWLKKFKANVERDCRTDLVLRSQGWQVIRFWEHDVKTDAEYCAESVKMFL